MQDVLVSICCLAYNHEKYIEECIHVFLMQETDFNFEIVIHDDCSTDRTLSILQNYQERFPEIVRIISQSTNQYSLGKSIGEVYKEFIYPQVSGKYIAYCEGDDFWSDPKKLQKQVEILESNENLHLCLHKVRTTNESGISQEITYPANEIETGEINKEKFLEGLTEGSFFHTSSFLCRTKDIQQLCKENPKFTQITYVNDVPLLLYLGNLGGIYYINQEMSCYRRNSIGSWTNNQAGNVSKILDTKRKMIEMYQEYNLYTKGQYSSIVQNWIDSEKIRIAEYERDYIEMIKPKYKKYLANRSLMYKIKIHLEACVQRIIGRKNI